MAVTIHPSFAMPAGVWLKEALVIPEAMDIGALAEALHVPTRTLNALLDGRAALTPALALRMEAVLGTSADTLMRMQDLYEGTQRRKAGQGSPDVRGQKERR